MNNIMDNQKITTILIIAYLALFFYIFLFSNEHMDAKERTAVFGADKKRIKRGGQTSVKFKLDPSIKKGTVRKKNISIKTTTPTLTPTV
jgi:hypothetical protein